VSLLFQVYEVGLTKMVSRFLFFSHWFVACGEHFLQNRCCRDEGESVFTHSPGQLAAGVPTKSDHSQTVYLPYTSCSALTSCSI